MVFTSQALPLLKLPVSNIHIYIYVHVYKYTLSATNIILLLLLDEKNVKSLFESLNRVEKMLEGKKYLIQDTFTEADIRLFTTIVR